jgi:hypothetical protein
MSRNNSTSSLHGFSVFQPALGSTLQWLPALGSYELDEMVHAFLPGPASIQDKRAHISMDFFEFTRQTGETFKFYPVYNASFASATTATASPASSSAMQDSGYGSSFNASPVVSDVSPWTPSVWASTPASTASDLRTTSRSGPSKRTASSGSRPQADFSSHPGMRILTKDGRDITNSASRGCKSKEQRDHAHLMRIIKACDACRRKKIRCDPSHKRRTSSQPQPSRSDQSKAKKSKPATNDASSREYSDATASLLDLVPSFEETDMTPADALVGLNQTPDDFWQQFTYFDDGATMSMAEDYDFSLDSQGYLASSNGSSSVSPAQSFQPLAPGVLSNYGLSSDTGSQEPALPYLTPGDSYGTNYQDFNLYSPTSDLEGLDDDWQSVRKPRRRRHTSKQDNMLESSFANAALQAPNLELSGSPYGSSDHLHTELVGEGLSNWPGAYEGDPIIAAAQANATATHSNDHTLGTSAQQPLRAQPLPVSLLGDTRALSRASPDGLREGSYLHARTQAAALATSTTHVGVSALSRPQELGSASADGQMYSAAHVDVQSSLQPVAQVGHDAAHRQLTRLAQASRSRSALTAGDMSPDGLFEQDANGHSSGPALLKATSLALRRGLFARSAFVLEPTDDGDRAAPDHASSAVRASSIAHVESGVNHDSDARKTMETQTVAAGLRTAPHAHYAPSGSASSTLSVAAADAESGPGGVLCVAVEHCQPSFLGTAVPGLDVLVTLGIVFCALTLLTHRAWSGLQRDISCLATLSVASFVRPVLQKRTLDGSCKAVTRPMGLLRHVGSAVMASSLIAV